VLTYLTCAEIFDTQCRY